MRVLLVGSGSRGDVQPLLALAHGLRDRGHGVLLAAPSNFRTWIEAHGFPFVAAGTDVEETITAEFKPKTGARLFSEAIRAQFALAAMAREYDLVVGAGLTLGARAIAEAAGVPHVFAALSPQWFPSRHLAPGVLYAPMPPWANRLAWRIALGGFRLLFLKLVNRERAALGLRPVTDVWDELLGRNPVQAFDPVFSPLPPDVATRAIPTGAWLLPETQRLDGDLEGFLDAGSAPIYIGFGSMPDLARNPDRTTAQLLTAIEQAGVRAVIASGWAKLGGGQLPKTVMAIGAAPHRALFPRCSLIVHHGGAGTTLTAAHAGVPQLLVPHVFDQFAWGEFARRIGACSQVLPRKRLTAARIEAAIRATLADDTLRERAKALPGVLVPDGVARAVDVLESLAAARTTSASAAVVA